MNNNKGDIIEANHTDDALQIYVQYLISVK